jgi:hypothetical protein
MLPLEHLDAPQSPQDHSGFVHANDASEESRTCL